MALQSNHPVLVYRSTFTSGIDNREPSDHLRRLSFDSNKVYFYTEIIGAKDKEVIHRWVYEGQPVADVSFSVGGDHWRTWSSKILNGRKNGLWEVVVLLSDGTEITREAITFGEMEEHWPSGWMRPSNAISVLIKRGDPSAVKGLIREFIETRKLSGDTPIFEAIKTGNSEMVEMMIDKGANIYARDYLGRLPLELAHYLDHQKIFQILEYAMTKQSPPWGIVRKAFVKSIVDNEPTQCLQEVYANETSVIFFTETMDMVGKNISHRWRYQDKVVKKVTFDVKMPRQSFDSKMQIAEDQQGRWEVDVLDSSGNVLANEHVNFSAKSSDRNFVDYRNCHLGSDAIFKMVRAWAPLEQIEYLWKKGAFPKINSVTKRLFLLAVKEGNIPTVRFLIDKGLPLSDRFYEKPPLIVAVKNRNELMLQFLIVHGADINEALWNTKSPPLLYAVKNNDYWSTKILLENGADSNQIFKNGNTPIEYALKHDWTQLKLLLLKHGAKIPEEYRHVYDE